MLRFLFGGLVFLVSIPIFVSGGVVQQCDPWVGNAPQPRQSNELQAEMRAAVKQLDTCGDERVVMSASLGWTGVTTYVQKGKTRVCTTDADKQKYGCEKGKIPPKVCIEIPDVTGVIRGGKFEVSKCDQDALADVIDRTVASKDTASLKSLAAQYKRGQALTEMIVNPTPHPDAATINRVIREVAPDPETVKVISTDTKMLEAIAKGDTTTIRERAEALGVDTAAAEKLANQAAKLAPDRRDTADPPNSSFTAKGRPDSTFASPEGIFGGLSKMLGGTSPFGSGGLLQNLLGGGRGLLSPFNIGRPTDVGTPTQVGSPFGGGRVSDILRDASQPGGASGSFSLPGVVTLTAQPENVDVGRSIVVSWSSIRVNSDTCVISMSGVSTNSQLAKGDTGMYSVNTKNMSKGTLTFKAQCSSTSRLTVSDMDSVILE